MDVHDKRKSKVTDEHLAEAARLRAIWERTPDKPTQAAFGELYEVGTQAAVGFFLNGKTPLSLKAAKGFSIGLNCSIGDFSTRLEKLAQGFSGSVIPASDDFVEVRRVDVSFSNGEGRIVYQEDDKPPLSFRTDFLRKLGIATGNAVVVDADGSSNYPTIRGGAVVLLNRGDTSNLNGDFFGFRANGELSIKRLSKLDGVGILATADNPDFRPKNKIYTEADGFEVIGRAVWTGAEL